MKTQTNNRFIIGSCLLLASFFISGCHEKGCTDPHAVNYNSVADQDDGSCIVCASVQTEIGTSTAELTDFNSSSPHYNEVVARLHLRQIKDSHNNSACGTSDCKIYFTIENLVNSRIDFFGQVQCSGGNFFFSFSQFETILANQSTTETIIPSTVSNPCGSLATSFTNFFTNGSITYH